MFRSVFAALAVLLAFTLPGRCAAPTFQTQSASEAVTEYLRAVEEARRTCLSKLDAAEKEAATAGKREDVQQIRSARSAVDLHRAANVFDPFAALQQQVAGTKWANRDNPRYWSMFDKDHVLRNSKGEAGKWAVVAEDTIASTTGVDYVYLWIISKDGQDCTLQRFRHDKDHNRPYRRQ
jgi:hypothetical protein